MDFLLIWYLCCDICMYMISYYWNFFDKFDEKNVIFFLDNGEKICVKRVIGNWLFGIIIFVLIFVL